MNNHSFSSNNRMIPDLLTAIFSRRAALWVAILLTALAGFEMFNFSTTQYALNDLLGQVRFAGLRWSTILALAFCGIDFAGIARLFTPEVDRQTSREVWFLFAAWLLAATMNAILTWWGVSMALANHTVTSTYIINPNILARGVPVFVAIVVWVTRFLLISTLSSAAGRVSYPATQRPVRAPAVTARPAQIQAVPSRAAVTAPRPTQQQPVTPTPRPRNTPISTPVPTPRPAIMVPPRSAPTAQPQPQRRVDSLPATPAALPRTDSPTSIPQPRTVNRPAIAPKAYPRVTKPRPQPIETPPPDESTLPEPEYIPDPFYSQPQTASHSLSASPDASSVQPKSRF